ncbi:solute carrier family 2, facilitated glucose transporter member 5-like isoform X2 [Lycorma delicatula]|uniref:solute carrier family 2, facilitated glucose transporter member 5-like isoform X2 n=1 Tax=Lycorma delicatula TaxID=130591 RepID=UPI003F5100D7
MDNRSYDDIEELLSDSDSSESSDYTTRQDYSTNYDCINANERSGKCTWVLALAGIVTTVGCSLPVGYNIGVMNTPQAIIKQWCNESLIIMYDFHLTQAQLNILWSTIVSIYLVGGMIGSLAGSLLADKLGRKGALLFSGAIGIIAAVLFVLSEATLHVELILIARFLIGLTSGVTTGVMPMYLCEIAPSNLRAGMGVLCPLGLTFGVVFSQFMGLQWVLGTKELWPYLLALYAVLMMICGLAIPCMPESPKYLYQVKGLKQKAARDYTSLLSSTSSMTLLTQKLARLRGINVEDVIGELEGESIQSNVEVWSVMRVLTTASQRLPLALTCALQCGQQTSGINAVFYYSMNIFETAGLSTETAQYASLGAGVVNFVVAVTMIPLVSHLPHRTLLILSCFLATCMLFTLTVCIAYINVFTWMPYFAVFCVMFYVLVYGIGLGPIPFFIGSELFDVGPRPAAMALGSVANWSGNFGVGMLFKQLLDTMGPYSFLVFGFCTALLTVFLKLFLPETNSKFLDDLDNEPPLPHVQSISRPTPPAHVLLKKGDRMLFQSLQEL